VSAVCEGDRKERTFLVRDGARETWQFCRDARNETALRLVTMINESKLMKAASRAVRDDVELVEEVPLEGASLTFWRGKRKLPSLKVAILETGDKVLVVNKSFKNLEKLLRVAHIPNADFSKLIRIFNRAAPGRRRVIEGEQDFMGSPPFEGWHPPRIVGEDLVFFSNDYIDGRIERVTVRPDGSLDVTYIGKGRRMPIR
jgi:hypothetical protein